MPTENDNPAVDFASFVPNLERDSFASRAEFGPRQLRGSFTARIPPRVAMSLGYESTGARLPDGSYTIRRVPANDVFTVNERRVTREEFVRICREHELGEAGWLDRFDTAEVITLGLDHPT